MLQILFYILFYIYVQSIVIQIIMSENVLTLFSNNYPFLAVEFERSMSS